MKNKIYVLLIVMFILVGCSAGNNAKSVDMKEYVVIEVIGNNGAGTLEPRINEKELVDRLIELKVEDVNILEIMDEIAVKASKTNSIMNGDVIALTITLNPKAEVRIEALQLMIENLTFEHEVEGLNGTAVITN